MNTRRLLAATLVALTGLTALAGCGQAEPKATAPGTSTTTASSGPVDGGSAIFYLGGDPDTFNPVYSNSGTSLPIVEFVYSPLLWGGENWGSDVVGDLAESWKLSDDGLVWTIKLRSGVKWHDGQPFTADDVVFTYNAVENEKLGTQFHEGFLVNGKPIKFEAVDPLTVKATLPEPYAPFLSHLSVPIMAKHVYEGETDLQKSPKNATPIGTGPFKFVSYKPGESVTLAANPDFYRGKPHLDKAIFRIVPNPDSAVVALQSGDLNFVGGMTWKNAKKFENDSANTLVAQTRDHLMYLSTNTNDPVLAQKPVRQAISYALDRNAMAKAFLLGFGEPADSLFTQTAFVYKKGDTSIPRYDFNKQKAQELLASAGYTDTDKDGFVDKDGKKLSLELITFPTYKDMLPIVQAQLKEVGIDLVTKGLDDAALSQATKQMNFQLALSGMAYFGRDPAAYSNVFAVTKDKQRNGWESQQLIADFHKAATTSDEAQRTALYKDAEKILLDELPMIPVLYSQAIVVHSKKLVVDDAKVDVNRLPQVRYPEKLWLKNGGK